MEVMDPSVGSWSALPSMTSRRFRFASAFSDGDIFVVGGMDGMGHILDTFEYFNV